MWWCHAGGFGGACQTTCRWWQSWNFKSHSVAALQLRSGHQVELLEGGQQFFPALIACIDASRLEVRLETYIFHFDDTGREVAAALVRAAVRGVQVYVVMDGVGTPPIPAHWVEQFAQAGVLWHRFSPLGRFGYLIPVGWRRLHRKLCVVDNHTLFCGGINILNDFIDPNHGTFNTPRYDFAVKVQGPLVQDGYRLLAQFWARLALTMRIRKMQLNRVGSAAWPPVPPAPPSGSAPMQAALVLRDNLLNRRRIERAYRKAIGSAQTEILIANAYFLPGRKIRNALIHAVRRGVKVKLLLHGRYEYFMQYHASRPIHHALLTAGVEIYEYTTGFLHAKVAVIDQNWATVGSSNLDPLSLLLAREANVMVRSPVFAQLLRQRLLDAMHNHAQPLEPDLFAHRPLRQRILDSVAYSLMRLSLFLTGKRY
jgi:cardiolipin synthase A/B